MQQILQLNTAATTIIGPVLDSAGAAYTALAIGDLNITKNGATAAMAAPATLTHDHNGHYLLALAVGNTDTLGRLDVTVNKATYAMPPKVFEVLTATMFRAIVTNGTISNETLAADTGLKAIRSGTCDAAGQTTTNIRLDAGASAVDGFYANQFVYFTGGTGAGQVRRILAYTGATKDCMVGVEYDNAGEGFPLVVAADGTTTFAIVPGRDDLSATFLEDDMAVFFPILTQTFGPVTVAAFAASALPHIGVAGQFSIQTVNSQTDITVSSWSNGAGPDTDDTMAGCTIYFANTTFGTDYSKPAYAQIAGYNHTTKRLTLVAAPVGHTITVSDLVVIYRPEMAPLRPSAAGRTLDVDSSHQAAATLSVSERNALGTALLDLADGVESGKTLRQALRIIAASLGGKRSHVGSATEQYDAIGSPGTARVVANTDGSGNGTPTLTP